CPPISPLHLSVSPFTTLCQPVPLTTMRCRVAFPSPPSNPSLIHPSASYASKAFRLLVSSSSPPLPSPPPSPTPAAAAVAVAVVLKPALGEASFLRPSVICILPTPAAATSAAGDAELDARLLPLLLALFAAAVAAAEAGTADDVAAARGATCPPFRAD
ncbi:unnamed protein product, partial [Closterium sp. NIES-54]